MHILIVRNNSNPQAAGASLLLASYLASQGIGHSLLDASELCIANEARHREELAAKGPGLVVVLGGDGSVLRSARLAHASSSPILGINFGHLGFLANSSEDGVVAIVAAALCGDIVCERRANLRIDVECIGDGEGDGREDGDEGFAGGGGGDGAQSPESMLFDSGIVPVGSSGTKGRRSFFALNEIALTRGPDGRVIEFTFGISDASIARIRGDGLVVATATGSSAYALSAGGPLASPDFQGMIVVPVAPHTLAARPIITASHDVVEIDLRGSRNIRSAVLFVDGEPLGFESPPARIWVRLGKEPTQLLRYKRQGFYEHAAQVFFK